MAFSPGGKQLAVGAERSLSLWDLGAGARKRFDGHEQPVGRVEFGSDERWLVSASVAWVNRDRAREIDTLVNLWDTATGERRTLAGHEDTVWDLGLAWLMMPSYDDGMRTIIDLPEEQIRALAVVCRRENISRAEAVRRAVAEYASRRVAGDAEKAFGLWRGRRIDGLAYERRLRREW